MKTRQGFVSNSSSSSFVVAFPHKPADEAELRSFLFFDKDTKYPSPWKGDSFCDTDSWPVEDVVKAVWAQMESCKPLTREDSLWLMHGFLHGCPDMNKFTKENSDIDWKAWQKARNEYSVKVHEKFVADNPDSKLFGFEFSDNRGEFESALEHGDVFRRLKHVIISNH